MSGRGIVVVITLFCGAVGSARSNDFPLRITVLRAESRQFQGPALNPPDCNWRDISAYCYSSAPQTYVENTMIIQEAGGNSVEIGCTVYNRWSHCSTLTVNQNFQARMKKHGLEIRYADQDGKMRAQVYEILGKNSEGAAP